MSKERDILKTLLLKEELEVLKDLQSKILSEEQFTQEVTKVLAVAMQRAQQNNQELEKALYVPIKKGVKKAFAHSKQSIIDAILPIMGQLIRKTVTNSIKQFVSDINRTIELGFSSKALKWRWQAFKSGTKFTEIVFQKTIRYQVKELFVINKHNGLLIDHVGDSEMLKDKNAISAMLTVIQDFIGDSLGSSENRLLSAETQDGLILISTGPMAYLASVIKGSPTERLKERSQQLVENIHAEFSNFLAKEEDYQNNPEFNDYLRSHLITKNISENKKSLNWMPWFLAFVLLLSAVIYYTYKNRQDYNQILNQVKSTPGLFVQNIEKKGSVYEITGLLDPSADVLTLSQQHNIQLNTRPYLSLDESLISKRVLKFTQGYPDLNVKIDRTQAGLVLSLSGLLDKDEYDKLMNQLNKIQGIDVIENNVSIDYQKQVNKIMASYPQLSKTLTYQIKDNQMALSGIVDNQDYQRAINAIRKILPDLMIDESNVQLVTEYRQLIYEISDQTIFFNKKINIVNNKKQLDELADKILKLYKNDNQSIIHIIGESDCNGKLSDEKSMLRAQKVKEQLIKLKVPEEKLMTTIKICDQNNKPANQLKLKVTFQIMAQ